ncbi:IS3 family transposase [Streptomyces sp. NBC_00841]|uniref:IS3 family transposase n=1 Tax=Streptomyces sp. NBC_00841 TaxID=2975847 RepID=UPI002DD9DEBF|nr:IS3 family transposase [Streptomyces sp. NBC_00841]WRZ97064.1 IS3 family transposase [Streptomyces sp. NBC_00841]
MTRLRHPGGAADCPETTLSTWVSRAKKTGGDGTLSAPEREELVRLGRFRRPAEPTKREVRRARLEERITNFFRESGDTYGSPRITLDLWAEGWQVSVNTVAEIMADLGLQGRKPPRRRRSLTRQGKRRAAPDLVHRRFDAGTGCSLGR